MIESSVVIVAEGAVTVSESIGGAITESIEVILLLALAHVFLWIARNDPVVEW